MTCANTSAIAIAMKAFQTQQSLKDALECIYSIRPHLQAVIEDMRDRDKDYRSGEEVYGYNSKESILGNLSYISDRWNASFRVSWMLGLVDVDYGPGKEALLERFGN